MSDAALRRARRRRRIEIFRYRLAMRIGGWVLREAEEELLLARMQLAEIRSLRAYSNSSMGRVYDYVKGVDLDRVLDGAESNAEPLSGASAGVEASRGTQEAQETRE